MDLIAESLVDKVVKNSKTTSSKFCLSTTTFSEKSSALQFRVSTGTYKWGDYLEKNKSISS